MSNLETRLKLLEVERDTVIMDGMSSEDVVRALKKFGGEIDQYLRDSRKSFPREEVHRELRHRARAMKAEISLIIGERLATIPNRTYDMYRSMGFTGWSHKVQPYRLMKRASEGRDR